MNGIHHREIKKIEGPNKHYVFWGSSQARTRELKKEFKLKGLKELKERVQTVVIWVLTQDKRSMFENVY